MTRLRVAGVVVAAVCLVVAWQRWTTSEERAIRTRLLGLASDLNGPDAGAASLLRAARFGDYFTDDVVVELGEGSPPIIGRATLVGMAARLERRTTAARLKFDDIDVRLRDDRTAADVGLTASFMREDGTGGDAVDAREFALQLVKRDGQWRVARAAAVAALR